MMDRSNELAGGLLGLLVGDALGVPYEFHPAHELPPSEAIELEPPPGFRRAHPGIAPGTWSDDGAQALCLLASLQAQGHLDVGDFGRRLLSWHDQGYLAVDGRVFDVGIQTARALRALAAGATPLEAGPSDERANGNGSLMRALPLALWHQGSDEELAHDATLQSRVTHGHPRSLACCALYVLWARATLRRAPEPWSAATAAARQLWRPGSPLRAELEEHVRPDDPTPGRGSGYVVDCLRSARHAVEVGTTYEHVVRAAISLGDDTDTTACVAGGIAGIRFGLEGIPQRWRAALRGREELRPLLDALLARG